MKNEKKLTESKIQRSRYAYREAIENLQRSLGKCSITPNFDSSCNLRCKNYKKWTETKTQAMLLKDK